MHIEGNRRKCDADSDVVAAAIAVVDAGKHLHVTIYISNFI